MIGLFIRSLRNNAFSGKVYSKLTLRVVVWTLVILRCNCAIDWSISKPKLCANNESYALVRGQNVTKLYYKLIITDLFDISEEQMEFGLQTLVFELWQDESWTELDEDNIGLTPESIPPQIQKCLWQPDLIFPNCKHSELYTVTVNNLFMKVLPEGFILRYSRYHMTVSCHMAFHHYPMDTQICGLNITLFSHFEEEVDLQWLPEKTEHPSLEILKPAVEVIDGVKPLQFSLKRVQAIRTRVRLTHETYTIILVCEFTFVRHLTASLVNTYIPSFLVVCLSMVSFWLDVSAVPGRVTLGVTALLTLSTMIVHARSSLPSVNYMTAIDVWLFGCLVMVFASLIEFTIAQTMFRRKSFQKTADVSKNSAVNWQRPAWIANKEPALDSTIPSKVSSELCEKKNPTLNNKDNNLDRLSRFLFPFLLTGFTSFYCVYYYTNAIAKQI